MKKILSLSLCAILSIVLLTGCVSLNFAAPGIGPSVTGRGSMETFVYSVGEITEVRVEMLSNIVLYSVPSNTVTFEFQPNLKDYIIVEESEGILTVRSTRNINVSGTGNIPVLTISTPSLSRLTHAGAGRFTAVDPIVGDDFSLEILGAADGYAQLNVQNLNLSIAGASNFELSGIAVNTDISMAGASNLEALELATHTTTINMAGVGNVRISCSDSLIINAGGAGIVEYRGNPSVDITRGGLVSVRQVN